MKVDIFNTRVVDSAIQLFRVVLIHLLLELPNISRKLPTRLGQTHNKNMGFFTCNTYNVKSSNFLKPQSPFDFLSEHLLRGDHSGHSGCMTRIPAVKSSGPRPWAIHLGMPKSFFSSWWLQCCNDGTSEIRWLVGSTGSL